MKKPADKPKKVDNGRQTDSYRSRLGELVASYRDRRGLSQEQLAAKAVVNQSTLSRLEAGSVTKPDTVAKVCRALDIPQAEIDRLSAHDFEIGTIELRLKTILMRAIARGELEYGDAAAAIEGQIATLSDPELQELPFSHSQRDRVLESLAADGLLPAAANAPALVLDTYVLREYRFHVRHIVMALLSHGPEHAQKTIAEASRILTSSLILGSAEDFFTTLEYAQLVLADNNALLAESSVHYVRMLRRFHDMAWALIPESDRIDFSERFRYGIRTLMLVSLAPHDKACRQDADRIIDQYGVHTGDTMYEDRVLGFALKEVEDIVATYLPRTRLTRTV
ncbi:MAG: helix-turn-helix transcriptional regulator [Pirellulales bacterium]